MPPKRKVPLSPEEALFGRRLRVERQRRGVTVAALAQAVGVRPWAIHLIERGYSRPSLHVARRIAAALRVPLDALAGPTPDVPQPDPG